MTPGRVRTDRKVVPEMVSRDKTFKMLSILIKIKKMRQVTHVNG